MAVLAVVGNPNPGGRTTTAAETVASRVASLTDGTIETIELADVAGELFNRPAPTVDALTLRVARTAAVVFASPTYKAGMTGLLKSFLDRYGADGLAGVVAIPLMLGGAPHHALAVETNLRPVLVELAAIVPTRGIYVIDSELDDLEALIDRWWILAEPPLRRLLA